MKIAVVSPYDLGLHGGVQDQVVRLSHWLKDLGHQSIVVGPGDEGPDGAVLLGPTLGIRANRSLAPISVNPAVSRRLKEAIEDVDVIHIHEPFMPAVSAAATSISTHPTVGTFHADPPSWARFGYRVGSPVWKRAIGRIDVVTTVSHVSGSAIAPFIDARVIPNGIDVDLYGGGEKVPARVAFLGRDDERKGLQVLLDAWPSVVESVPGAALVVIGTHRDEQISGVAFLGRVDDATKRAELAKAEIFCAPNLGGESFGIVVAEGMASGCAVVASDIPAFADVLGQSGVLTTPDDSSGLARALVSLLNDRPFLHTRQRSALAAVERFDGMSVANQYANAYEDAISHHRA
jgi:phosphatidylinositol alpha-mannosyltransferase